MAAANAYEEQRRRRMEENKRKFDELGLHTISAAFRQAPAPQTRPRKPRVNDVPTRRSCRIGHLPEQPDYRAPKVHRRPPRAVPAYEREAITKAQELKGQLELGSDHPAFVMPMSHDYATKSYRLPIPRPFRQYLPSLRKNDAFLPTVLVDEANKEFEMLYGATTQGKRFLTDGWRAFADAHELADGDCLVFQLIGRTKFKVYIVTADEGVSFHFRQKKSI